MFLDGGAGEAPASRGVLAGGFAQVPPAVYDRVSSMVPGTTGAGAVEPLLSAGLAVRCAYCGVSGFSRTVGTRCSGGGIGWDYVESEVLG